MTLTDKFDAIEIGADDHITEADRKFCQKHQAAYSAAMDAFGHLLKLWQDAMGKQRNILFDVDGPDTDNSLWYQYLSSDRFPELTDIQIMLHMNKLHTMFISRVVGYLNAAYHLTVDPDVVKAALLPKPTSAEDDPDDDSQEEAVPVVENKQAHVILHYENIINLILSWFEGRELSEQAPYQLAQECHKAAWNSSKGEARFVQKKNLVKFLTNACNFGWHCKDDQHSGGEQWYFNSGMKQVLRALAYFETGFFDEYPGGMGDLLSESAYVREWNDLFEFEGCTKLEKIKLFKNGRMDIRFANEGFARQFVSEYLGAVL